MKYVNRIHQKIIANKRDKGHMGNHVVKSDIYKVKIKEKKRAAR